MTAFKNEQPARAGSAAPEERVRTVISCPGVQSMARAELKDGSANVANENAWFDPIRRRRHWYANLASLAFAGLLLTGGVWIVSEFVRLQKLEACFEAGRRDCMPLDYSRRHPAAAAAVRP